MMINYEYYGDALRLKYRKIPQPSWACARTKREAGLVEDLCEHGVGHPNAYWVNWVLTHLITGVDYSYFWVHGCCGCCYKSRPTLEVDVW